jgi:ADP-ribose pyrophosphatase
VSHGFRRLDEREVHRGHVVRMTVATFAAPDGSTFERDVVRHPGAVGIVAVDEDGSVTLVRQYRAAIDDELLEVPAGTLEPGGEEPLACARRELAEEVGLAADRWELLCRFHVAPGFSDEVFHLYLARGLRRVPDSRQGIEEQAMTVEVVALDDVDRLLAAGELTDAKTIVGLLAARDRLAGA